MNAIQKLRQLVTEIRKSPSADAWALAERLLLRATPNQAEVKRVCAARDVTGLDSLVLAQEGHAPAGSAPSPSEAPEPPAVSENDMAAALRAFKKRLKVMRLAEESKLGGRYTSSGRKSSIDAIVPPNEFPPEVWRALERAGKLRHTGQGFYAEP